jgi:uncharacterized protein YqiB (DUF1249 family)
MFMFRLRAPYINDYKIVPKIKYRVNLPLQMAECELNYIYLTKIFPDINAGARAFSVLAGNSPWHYKIKVIERSVYTTTLTLTQTSRGETDSTQRWLNLPVLTVRMYHDALLAEVLDWAGHKRLRPRYDYPNKSMYHCDEKLQVNQFLGEWLRSCLSNGLDDSHLL